MTQYNGPQHQLPVSNINIAVAAPTVRYYPYMAPLSGINDISVPLNYGGHNQLSRASTDGISGIHTVSYGSNIAYRDGIRSLNRKNSEGLPVNYQYHNASAGSSSSATPTTGKRAERDVALMNEPHDSALFYAMTQYNGPQHQHPVSNINIAVAAPTVRYYPYMAPLSGINDISVPLNYGGHNQLSRASTDGISGIHTVSYGSNIAYRDGIRSLNRKNSEGLPVNYQYRNASAGSSSSTTPTTGKRAERDVALMNGTSFQPPEHGGNELTTSMVENEFQRSARNRSNMILPEFVMANNSRHLIQGSYFPLPVQAIVGADLPAPVPPTSFQLYWQQRREVILDPNAMHQNLPNMRLLPVDASVFPLFSILPFNEMAMLNFPGYHEAGVFIDQHWDIRLDVDLMTYEELLALEEQIGIVGAGLSEEDIQNSLKTRTFSSLATCLNHKKAATVDQQSDFCVICQVDFEDQENVGNLDCGHEYHGDCIMKWLLIKNSCSICKSTALTTVKKNCK
ncbi:unnamed protein product [Fraxinus pennsylvanica]|uniref:RING-type E3 ubiquitin transferase n=1 Tax=Fraxinus pennsylvanica TaxID=56036 RepID=A0AAD1YT38_9LAMI|nr:unnamed protein product [Fraxinus pennsylvanica]